MKLGLQIIIINILIALCTMIPFVMPVLLCWVISLFDNDIFNEDSAFIFPIALIGFAIGIYIAFRLVDYIPVINNRHDEDTNS